jgi:hypothetical protein
MRTKTLKGPKTKGQKRADCRSLAELVERYDLRYAHEPGRPYPVEGNYGIPEGWIPLVERLVQRLIRLGWDRHLAQVKPKFGGLRFYVGESTEPVSRAIHRANRLAERTCCVCGKAVELGDEEMRGPLCEKHRRPLEEGPPSKLVASTIVSVRKEDHGPSAGRRNVPKRRPRP